MSARPIGVMDMIDSGESDAKIIAVPDKDVRFTNIKDLQDVNEHTIKEIKHFFETYKSITEDVVTIPTIRGKEEAIDVIKEGIELYKKENNK